MAAIRSTGMKPEIIVRSLVHRLGYRYRLHAKDLPGKPDLVFRPRKKVIFVHGCFWHQHPKHSARMAGHRNRISAIGRRNLPAMSIAMRAIFAD